LRTLPAGAADQGFGLGADGGAVLAGQGLGGQQVGDHGRFVAILAVVEAVPVGHLRSLWWISPL
jgi:hypothetical protein